VSRPPPGAWGKPTSSASQRITARSRWTSAWSPATTLGFIAAAASEAAIPAGDGGGLTQPKKAGSPLPMACGAQRGRDQVVKCGRALRRWQVEQSLAQSVRERLPDRARWQRCEMVGDAVHERMGSAAERPQLGAAVRFAHGASIGSAPPG
jgi:hypothetical protein